ncbi:membrane hypothetical protein [Hyphomicrobiales bacterium]|nr:membrane hypothetical protein [Hyphomicrobiales bacterium]CAH1698728.1 membrane hypothetical protein [Hyphomicrobiales bacterium]CAI0342376.1 membrane hypothetical protein [Hyphomicrobiales bacterium]
MEKRMTLAIAAAAAFVGFAYGAALDNLGSDPASWLRPLFGVALAVVAFPGFTLVAMICFVTGMPTPAGNMLVLSVGGTSAAVWLAVAICIWYRRGGYARYSSAAD